MRCKDFKRLVIEYSPEELSRDEQKKIEQHAACCAECAALGDDLRVLRRHVTRLSTPVPSDTLTQKIRSLCLADLQNPVLEKKLEDASPSTRIPHYVWAALSLLIVLTGIFIFPFFKELTLSSSFRSLMTLTLLVQNGVMLCFTPILLRKFREKRPYLTI